MILFFHFICLLARYIISNISKSISKRKVLSNDENEKKADISQSSDFFKSKKGNQQPVYEDGTLKFFPPVYVQRYETVAIILQDAALKGKVQKVVDFGCAELGLFMYLKNIEGVTEILGVDIDSEILERAAFKVAPLTSDYLMSKNNNPLDVYILSGSIEDYDDHLLGTDAVVAIELIEHLSEKAFKKMPYNVFHRIKPKIAIFTTPNADFNCLFPNFTNVRHSDHKFEWSRKEFYKWTREILRYYPEYSVKFYGIGAGPEGTENLGCCTQMAVFHRSEEFEFFTSAREELSGIHNYKLIKHFKYPVYVDPRTTEEKIIHEIQYQVSHISALYTYYNYEENKSEIPLSLLKDFVSDLCSDEEELRDILRKNGMNIRSKDGSWFLICEELESDSSNTSLRDEDWSYEEAAELRENQSNVIFEEEWDWNEDQLYFEDKNFQSARSLYDMQPEAAESSRELYVPTPDCFIPNKDETKSTPKSCNQLVNLKVPTSLAVCRNKENNELRKIISLKSKIPRKKDARDLEEKSLRIPQKSFSYVCKNPMKISKSCSLDSCLENINGKIFESEAYYLNLIPGGYVPFRNVGLQSSNKNKHGMNNSGSSLLSSSFDRAPDSGYPFSFSPPEADMTPEQVDELFTENEMSRSSSASSESEIADAVVNRIHHDLFVENIVVENGDFANNNRDREGNNVEGLMGQRLINEIVAERDPNDNMFFPEIEEFPPWLLNLGDLALHPVYGPLNDFYDEGVGDDSSSDFNQSLDPEDIDIYFDASYVS